MCKKPQVHPPAPHKTVEALRCDPSTLGVEAGGPQVPGLLPVHSEFEISLGSMRPSLKTTKDTGMVVGACICLGE